MFDLHVNGHDKTRVTRVVETPRFDSLVQASARASPPAQVANFPPDAKTGVR